MSKCPCGSGKTLASCCEPFLKGDARPATAEQLMRSRYTAFTRADVEYVEQTTDPSSRSSFDRAGTTEWAKGAEWQGLEIVSTEAGGATDNEGVVEFIARYRFQDVDRAHHERSEFKKRDGQWYFLDGKLVQEPYRAPERAGRNDPCPCGSGKKFKKCCGA